MADDKKRVIPKFIDNEKRNITYSDEEIAALKLYTSNFDERIKELSGSKFRDIGTLTAKDFKATGDFLRYLELLNNKEGFTTYNVSDIRLYYITNKKFPEQFKGLIKDYQMYDNAVREEMGRPIIEKIDNSEKNVFEKYLKEIKKLKGYSEGKPFKAEFTGKIGKTPRDAKFIMTIDEKGNSNMEVYENRPIMDLKTKEITIKNVKTLTFEYDNENKKYKDVKVHNQNVDGVPGTQTYRGYEMHIKKAEQKERGPTQKVVLEYSLNEHYKNRNYYRGRFYFKKLLDEKGVKAFDEMYTVIKELSPENLREIATNKKYEKYNIDRINERIIIDEEKIDFKEFIKIVEEFKKDTKDLKKEYKKPFYFKENVSNTSEFDLDYKNIKEYLGKLGLNKIEIEGLILKIDEIKSKSKDLYDFEERINKNEIVLLFDKSSIDFGYCPFEQNLYNLDYYRYDKEFENIINKKLENTELEKNLKKYVITGSNLAKKIMNLKEIKEDYPNTYPEIIKEIHNFEYYKIKNKHGKVKENYEEKKIDNKKTEALPFPTKSPTAEETKAFKNELKGSSALTRVYQEKINEYLKENEPKTKKLIVDGMFGDNSEKWLNHVAGDKIWTIMEREKQKPHTQNEIYQEIGKNIWENKNELDKGKFKRGKSEFESFKKYVLEQEKGFGTGKKYNLNNREEFNNAWKVFGGSFIERNVKQRIETKDIEKKHKTIPRY